mmetsp:Transcript_15624/g.36880  ORF Transcript_15624/g.36880 Transcript_15624/m.36880 type:complete len:421 (-) Transcript_15624:210-1472(-)
MEPDVLEPPDWLGDGGTEPAAEALEGEPAEAFEEEPAEALEGRESPLWLGECGAALQGLAESLGRRLPGDAPAGLGVVAKSASPGTTLGLGLNTSGATLLRPLGVSAAKLPLGATGALGDMAVVMLGADQVVWRGAASGGWMSTTTPSLARRAGLQSSGVSKAAAKLFLVWAKVSPVAPKLPACEPASSSPENNSASLSADTRTAAPPCLACESPADQGFTSDGVAAALWRAYSLPGSVVHAVEMVSELEGGAPATLAEASADLSVPTLPAETEIDEAASAPPASAPPASARPASAWPPATWEALSLASAGSRILLWSPPRVLLWSVLWSSYSSSKSNSLGRLGECGSRVVIERRCCLTGSATSSSSPSPPDSPVLSGPRASWPPPSTGPWGGVLSSAAETMPHPHSTAECALWWPVGSG